MSPLSGQVFEIQSCSEGSECLYSVENTNVGGARCGLCKYAPNAPGFQSFWVPKTRGTKHPAAVAAKKEKKDERLKELRQKRATRDRVRIHVSKQAARAERDTEQSIIKATKNSGRSHRDGDHIAAGQITLDTKLQSKRINPIVLMEQLAKVREDAQRARNPIGALVLRNSRNQGVVVLHEDDFARIIAQLR